MVSPETSQAIAKLVHAEAEVNAAREAVRVLVFADLTAKRITDDEAADIYDANGIMPAPILPTKDEPHA